MRKYKAWDKETELMNDVTVIDFENEEVYYKHWRYGHSEAISFKDVELLQSTGLFDKNGTEIYEGDILHHKVQGTGVVFYPYRDTMASFGIRNVNTNFGRNLQDTAKAGYEVIGNKFEHLHLLREE